ncbi:hypothetical protein PSEUBRA_005663 [Kalmanozyma brasiliensis GHG001]|uniref:uncharacterized protein n=1 Tax=Kalmanozyma brasiliensis (strain GHG001) TaxID=1365824 RepID=UPI002867EB41|nr:uncharacterized protein PSEUBRA_005663 [Kalmanozyma brasiliensis GHG001]EST05384.2 hypothetical protein PSEUBRA_005663 [Kalmanozyma brasiliensis GHG001]
MAKLRKCFILLALGLAAASSAAAVAIGGRSSPGVSVEPPNGDARPSVARRGLDVGSAREYDGPGGDSERYFDFDSDVQQSVRRRDHERGRNLTINKRSEENAMHRAGSGHNNSGNHCCGLHGDKDEMRSRDFVQEQKPDSHEPHDDPSESVEVDLPNYDPSLVRRSDPSSSYEYDGPGGDHERRGHFKFDEDGGDDGDDGDEWVHSVRRPHHRRDLTASEHAHTAEALTRTQLQSHVYASADRQMNDLFAKNGHCDGPQSSICQDHSCLLHNRGCIAYTPEEQRELRAQTRQIMLKVASTGKCEPSASNEHCTESGFCDIFDQPEDRNDCHELEEKDHERLLSLLKVQPDGSFDFVQRGASPYTTNMVDLEPEKFQRGRGSRSRAWPRIPCGAVIGGNAHCAPSALGAHELVKRFLPNHYCRGDPKTAKVYCGPDDRPPAHGVHLLKRSLPPSHHDPHHPSEADEEGNLVKRDPPPRGCWRGPGDDNHCNGKAASQRELTKHSDPHHPPEAEEAGKLIKRFDRKHGCREDENGVLHCDDDRQQIEDEQRQPSRQGQLPGCWQDPAGRVFCPNRIDASPRIVKRKKSGRGPSCLWDDNVGLACRAEGRVHDKRSAASGDHRFCFWDPTYGQVCTYDKPTHPPVVVKRDEGASPDPDCCHFVPGVGSDCAKGCFAGHGPADAAEHLEKRDVHHAKWCYTDPSGEKICAADAGTLKRSLTGPHPGHPGEHAHCHVDDDGYERSTLSVHPSHTSPVKRALADIVTEELQKRSEDDSDDGAGVPSDDSPSSPPPHAKRSAIESTTTYHPSIEYQPTRREVDDFMRLCRHLALDRSALREVAVSAGVHDEVQMNRLQRRFAMLARDRRMAREVLERAKVAQMLMESKREVMQEQMVGKAKKVVGDGEVRAVAKRGEGDKE